MVGSLYEQPSSLYFRLPRTIISQIAITIMQISKSSSSRSKKQRRDQEGGGGGKSIRRKAEKSRGACRIYEP